MCVGGGGGGGKNSILLCVLVFFFPSLLVAVFLHMLKAAVQTRIVTKYIHTYNISHQLFVLQLFVRKNGVKRTVRVRPNLPQLSPS